MYEKRDRRFQELEEEVFDSIRYMAEALRDVEKELQDLEYMDIHTMWKNSRFLSNAIQRLETAEDNWEGALEAWEEEPR